MNNSKTTAHRNPKFYQTLSWKLVLVFIGMLSVVLVGLLALVAVTLKSYLMNELDKSLTSSGKIFASQTVDQLITGSQNQILPSDFYFRIDLYGAGSAQLAHPTVIQNYGTPANSEILLHTVDPNPRTVMGTHTDIPWRIITIKLTSTITGNTIGTLLIAHHLQNVYAMVDSVVRIMAFLSAIIVLFGAFSAYISIQLSLRRLRDIEQVTHAVAAGDYSVRVPSLTQDESEISLLGSSINEMLRAIEQSFEAKKLSEQNMRRFVSDASHELRTPLATVRGYAELYRLGGVPAEQVRHAFERVESEASRMANLVEDLLQLARLDEGRQLRFTQVELVSTAMNSVADFLVRSPNRPASVISLSGHELEPIVINADQDRITQLITNLLTNVITHTPDGTAVEVAVGVKDKSGKDIEPHTDLTKTADCYAVIEVRDHGPGINPEDSERIFERFYRTDSSRSRDSGGTGLGLAIVAAICAAHGGSARILQTPGGGLTVQMKFPSLLTKATEKARCIAESEGTISTHLPSQVQAIITGDYKVE
ncbi:HAMP domain-containing sensor histidine kinase [Arcanobacterium hippocoleae]